MSKGEVSDKVHFVGSIGLHTVEDVFHCVGPLLGDSLRRVPDGEVGGRRHWAALPYLMLRSSPYLRPVESAVPPYPGAFLPQLELAPGVSPDQVVFGESGYAREARTSYQDFLEAQQKGILPRGIKFQVSLPTPFAVIAQCVCGPGADVVEEALAQALLREVSSLCQRIPHKDLCIQWDICVEMIAYDAGAAAIGIADTWRKMLGKDVREGILRRVKRISDAVPMSVDVGYHFCYGDTGPGIFERPDTPHMMLDLYDGFTQCVTHPIRWAHMPVPLQADAAFFEPFSSMRLAPDRELYLGMIQDADGAAGLQRKIAIAHEHIEDFGIAAPCGISRRRDVHSVRKLLELHAVGVGRAP